MLSEKSGNWIVTNKNYVQVSIIYIGILAAPEGIQRLQSEHSNVPIYVGAIDSHLNDIGFIVPGLGDAGDRQFGT